MTEAEIESQVKESLKNAEEAYGGNYSVEMAQYITDDLLSYDADLEDVEEAVLLPIVRRVLMNWKKAN